MKSTNPNLQIYLPKKANSEKLGLGIDNPRRIVIFFEFADEQVLGEGYNHWHFWNPGVFSSAMISRCHPNSRLFFHRHIYSVCHAVLLQRHLPLPAPTCRRGPSSTKIPAERSATKSLCPVVHLGLITISSSERVHEFSVEQHRVVK